MLNLTLFAWKWSWWRIKIFAAKIFTKGICTLNNSRFYVEGQQELCPFTCKFPMVMYFVPILHKHCRSKTNFYVFSYDKTSLNFCASIRFFHAVFMEKFQKIHYLNYVRRGIIWSRCLSQFRSPSKSESWIKEKQNKKHLIKLVQHEFTFQSIIWSLFLRYEIYESSKWRLHIIIDDYIQL